MAKKNVRKSKKLIEEVSTERKTSLRLQNTSKKSYSSSARRKVLKTVESDVAGEVPPTQGDDSVCKRRKCHDSKASVAKEKEEREAKLEQINIRSCENGAVDKCLSDDAASGDLEVVSYGGTTDARCENEETSKPAVAGFVRGTRAKGDTASVKDTIRIFNTYFLHFVQEEEKRCKKSVVKGEEKKGKKSKTEVTNCSKGEEKKGKKSKIEGTNCSKNENPSEDKRAHKRPDLKALSQMLERDEVLYGQKRIGALPGVDVGYQFFSRAEMAAVGIHRHWLNGIDYMGKSYAKMKEYKEYSFPIAVAIVLSGQYEDDLDNSEEVVYTGQGGNDLLGNKRQVRDQVMERGNLALKNNMDHSISVRVIRGHECSKSFCGKVYTYDGLYQVINSWAEKGVSGYTVFKYRLKRIEGQATLTTTQVHYFRERGTKILSELPGLVCDDICEGQEGLSVPATNIFDQPPLGPTGFKYMKSVQINDSIKIPSDAPGCKCKENCINPRTCECARLNGDDFPYVRRDGGRLIEAKDVIYECGPKCGCGPNCINRISQRGLKYRLEVFRSPNKGWAVRSWDFIPSGAPVCEYTGVLKNNDDLDHVCENDYIFDIDCWHTMNGIGGRERRSKDVSMQTNGPSEKSSENLADLMAEFCIDAGSSGNVARFINHSCEPNLFVQCVLSSHHDIRLARVVLFAADSIPPMQELTYDYGYALDSVVGVDGKVKQLPCHCGAEGCRGRLY